MSQEKRTISPLKRTRLLWGFFLGILAYAVPRTVGLALGWNPPWLIYADFMDFVAPVGFLILLCFWTLGYGRGFFFLTTAFALSSAFEIASLHGAGIFGGAYSYAGIRPQVFGLPLIIPFYWTGLIFIAYAFVNSFLAWTGRSLPSRSRGGPALVGLLAVLDGLLVTAIDLAMDPICVKAGLWSWTPTGPFFGVPLGNFLGWFVVAALSTSVFRTVEYVRPLPERSLPPALTVLPVLGYGLIGVGLVLEGWIYGLRELLVLPALTIGPAVLLNIVLFLGRRSSRLPRMNVRAPGSPPC